MRTFSIGIVTPALAQANNGNWRTAARWARMLRPAYGVRVLAAWHGEPFDLLIALHARKSAESIRRWTDADTAAAGRHRPVILALTGTDLYGAISTDDAAQRSLARADAIVVLQDQAPAALPASLQNRIHVVYQSAPGRRALAKTARHLRVVMVGHLRDEKDPRTLFDAARRLRDRSDIHIEHIGAALVPALEREARRTMRECPRYRWLGALAHGDTLRRIQRAHLLVHTSRIEGGAHAILEAVCSGTAVMASDIDGNRGMLGTAYGGYFPVGDAAALAQAIARCRDTPAWRAQLEKQCRARAPCFQPRTEERALHRLVGGLLAAHKAEQTAERNAERKAEHKAAKTTARKEKS